MNGSFKGMPRASLFLENFLENKGKTIYLRSEDVYSIITSSKRCMDHFNFNMNLLRSVCEETVTDNATVYIASSPDSQLKGSCYSNPDNCVLNHGNHMADSNIIEIDWHYSVGDSYCSLVAKVTKEGDYYYMDYKYYIIDIYEWGWHAAKKDYYQHMLHECGLAHEYLINGCYSGMDVWKSGERYEQCE